MRRGTLEVEKRQFVNVTKPGKGMHISFVGRRDAANCHSGVCHSITIGLSTHKWYSCEMEPE